MPGPQSLLVNVAFYSVIPSGLGETEKHKPHNTDNHICPIPKAGNRPRYQANPLRDSGEKPLGQMSGDLRPVLLRIKAQRKNPRCNSRFKSASDMPLDSSQSATSSELR